MAIGHIRQTLGTAEKYLGAYYLTVQSVLSAAAMMAK
jgi:hypothetical protein